MSHAFVLPCKIVGNTFGTNLHAMPKKNMEGVI